jgi:hypothetical protein
MLMSITREDAADALRLADEAERRSRVLRGYQSAAPHLILWGCVYAATYSFSYFQPMHGGLAWLIVVPLALIGDVAISWRDRPNRADRLLMPVMIATFLAFIVATTAIMRPHDPRQTAAFVPLAVAWAYVAMGAYHGRRMTFAGIALGALTVFGYFVVHAWLMLWMAAVGGGTLLLTGYWLRRA